MSKKTIFGASLLIILLVPAIALAQGTTTTGFTNPLGSNKPEDFIESIINFFLGLVFLLALLALIVGGVRMVASLGNEQAVASAKKMILWAIIGLIVVIMSWAIIRLVVVDFLGVP